MKSLPTILQDPYVNERANNDPKTVQLFSALFPNLDILRAQEIFNTLELVGEANLNLEIINKVIEGINLIKNESRQGRVLLIVNDIKVSVKVQNGANVSNSSVWIGGDLDIFQ